MNINGKEVKLVRPMTVSEKSEYFNDSKYLDENIFCIELEDSVVLLPKGNCVNCMEHKECLFSLIQLIP